MENETEISVSQQSNSASQRSNNGTPRSRVPSQITDQECANVIAEKLAVMYTYSCSDDFQRQCREKLQVRNAEGIRTIVSEKIQALLQSRANERASSSKRSKNTSTVGTQTEDEDVNSRNHQVPDFDVSTSSFILDLLQPQVPTVITSTASVVVPDFEDTSTSSFSLDFLQPQVSNDGVAAAVDIDNDDVIVIDDDEDDDDVVILDEEVSQGNSPSLLMTGYTSLDNDENSPSLLTPGPASLDNNDEDSPSLLTPGYSLFDNDYY